jgi:3alpha(or 20beta)-hydroxysteroid dehydrogenase
MDMGRLDGKVALISGAARGLGQAQARLFAADGDKVAICDLIEAEGKALAQEIGSGALYQHLDVTSEDGWAAAVASTTGAFGRLDVLVNNAGIAESAPLAEMTLDSYRRVTEVNQTGVFLGMKAAIEPMKAAGGGSILNVSSIDGIIGMNNLTSYVASKFAVRGMTKVAAMELGPFGIRVNSIHPGFVPTSMAVPDGMDASPIHDLIGAYGAHMAPLGRAGSPEDIAKLALFLASDESGYSTGSEFVADGGLIAGYPPPGSAHLP